MSSDLEARLRRAEQLAAVLARQLGALGPIGQTLGNVAQQLASSGGWGSTYTGGQTGVYTDPICGTSLPTVLSLQCPFFTPPISITWYPDAGQWIGAALATQNVAISSDCVHANGTQSALVFQLTPGTGFDGEGYSLAVQFQTCVGGPIPGVLVQNAIPAELTGNDLFGASTGSVFAFSVLDCDTQTLSFAGGLPLSSGGSYEVMPP